MQKSGFLFHKKYMRKAGAIILHLSVSNVLTCDGRNRFEGMTVDIRTYMKRYFCLRTLDDVPYVIFSGDTSINGADKAVRGRNSGHLD